MVSKNGSSRKESRRSRVLAAAATAAAVALAVSACGASSSAAGSDSDTFTLRLSSDVPATSASGLADALFAKKVEEYTNGKVKVKVYPLSQLGTEATVLTGVQTGSIDLADLYTGSVVGQLPSLGLYSLPFLIRSEEGAAALFDSDVTKKVLDGLSEKNLKGLFIDSNGPFEVLSKKAINTPADFKGQKLRVNTDPISAAMLKRVDATAVPLPSLQVYSALQQGLVTGGITAPAGMASLKWYEQAKELSLLEPQWDAQLVVASPTLWNRLPSQYKEAITKAIADTLADNKTTALTATQTNVDLLKKGGVTSVSPDKTPFRDAESAVYDEFADSIGQETIDAATKLESAY